MHITYIIHIMHFYDVSLVFSLQTFLKEATPVACFIFGDRACACTCKVYAGMQWVHLGGRYLVVSQLVSSLLHFSFHVQEK